MNINRRIFCVVAFLLAAQPTLHAQVAEKQRTPFDEYLQVARQVVVFDRSMFSSYTGPSVARANVSTNQERRRIGVVNLSPKLSVYVDQIEHLIHGETYLELTDTRSGVSVAKFNLGLVSPSDHMAKLLFNGQGVVYLHHVPTSVCRGSATRKFVWNGRQLSETKQALVYLMEGSTVLHGSIKLFSSLDPSSPVVANLLDETSVDVIGMSQDSLSPTPKSQYLPNLLIRTPLGLTGWYLPGYSGPGSIDITNCN